MRFTSLKSAYTNSIIAIGEESPLLIPVFIILVYPPFLSVYLGATSANKFATVSLSLKNASALLFYLK